MADVTVDAPSAATINDLAGRLRAATGAELAVVTLPAIGDRAPVDVATAIGRAWGVGAKADIGDERRNAGMVLLLLGVGFILSAVASYKLSYKLGLIRDKPEPPKV